MVFLTLTTDSTFHLAHYPAHCSICIVIPGSLMFQEKVPSQCGRLTFPLSILKMSVFDSTNTISKFDRYQIFLTGYVSVRE